jgi:hypothetical protein
MGEWMGSEKVHLEGIFLPKSCRAFFIMIAESIGQKHVEQLKSSRV